jgi:hypothetical protein
MMGDTTACLRSENPHRLVSLWDLMKNAPIVNLIEELRNLWIASGMVSLLATDDARLQASLTMTEKHLERIGELCGDLDLPMTRLHVKDAIGAVNISREDSRQHRLDTTDRACMVLSNNLEKEMSLKLYFTLPHDKAEAYQRNDFGELVAEAFPSAAYDISEACRCYALARNTACVFHLMRVMEIGLVALSKQFGLPCDHTNWETVINGVEKAIASIEKSPSRPDSWRGDREFYSQCASHFRVVKDAWRNYTAHARGKYDEQEAVDMLGNVRGFMQKLATRLREVPGVV